MRRRTGRALLVATALALAGCGDDGDDAGGAAATTVSTTATRAPSGSAPSTSNTATSNTAAAPGAPDLGAAVVTLEDVADVEDPTAMAVRPGDDALYVAERAGAVRLVRDGALREEPFLDMTERTTTDSERGLLGIAFSPAGDRFYASYTNRDGDSRVDEYRLDGDRLDAGSRREVLAVEQPFGNHNGGNIVFGPDGFLWYGLGDGGGAGDPQRNGQDTSTLLGSLLRIDPLGGDPYAIPDGNPFVDGGGRPEIWAYGLRNPWRFSFDRATGDLWIADVGQSDVEAIYRLPAGEGAGANFGWNLVEGGEPFAGEPPPGAVPPVHTYGHDDGCSITGGYVYRGAAIPALRGAYVFSDYCASDVRAVAVDRSGGATAVRLDAEGEQIVSFGEGPDGELYVLSFGSGVQRLVPG